MSVKVLDAGGKLVLSSDLKCEVEVALSDYINRGAKLISVVQQLGSVWVAACTLPAKGPSHVATSLNLSDDVAQKSGGVMDRPEFDDGCTVEALGFKRLITGPNRHAVEIRIEHLKQFGGEVVTEPEQIGEQWIAVVDTGGADKAFRWS